MTDTVISNGTDKHIIQRILFFFFALSLFIFCTGLFSLHIPDNWGETFKAVLFLGVCSGFFLGIGYGFLNFLKWHRIEPYVFLFSIGVLPFVNPMSHFLFPTQTQPQQQSNRLVRLAESFAPLGVLLSGLLMILLWLWLLKAHELIAFKREQRKKHQREQARKEREELQNIVREGARVGGSEGAREGISDVLELDSQRDGIDQHDVIGERQ